MDKLESRVAKRYYHSFVLDSERLLRIVAILQGRYDNLDERRTLEFQVNQSKGTTVILTSAQDVLALDNTTQDPVTGLTIRLSPAEGGVGPTAVVAYYGEDNFSYVELIVQHKNSKYSSELFRDLEQQIYRTLETDWVHRIKRGTTYPREMFPALTLLIGFLLGLYVMLIFVNPRAEYIPRILQLADSAGDIDKKVDFLFQLEVERLSVRKPVSLPQIASLMTWGNLLLFLPGLLIVGCAGYAIFRCYPAGVFDWGDCKRRYASLVEQRRICWWTVAISLVLGLIGNLSSAVIQERLNLR